MGYHSAMMIRPLFALVMSLLVVASAPAHAGDSEHDRARRAVEAGEIRPLRDSLAAAEAAFGGQFIEAELEHEDGRWIYEIKLISAEGQLMRLDYDARNGALLQARTKGRHR